MVPGLHRSAARGTLIDMNATTAHNPHDNSLAGARAWFAKHGLTRPREGRILAGVTTGFARRYGVNVLVARVAAVAGVLLLTPLLYLPLWVLMPKDPAA
jgi:phage shock protein C